MKETLPCCSGGNSSPDVEDGIGEKGAPCAGLAGSCKGFVNTGSFDVALGLVKLNRDLLLVGNVDGFTELKIPAAGLPVVAPIALFESAFSIEVAGALKAGSDVVVCGKLGKLNRGVEEGAVVGALNAAADEEVVRGKLGG